MHADLDLIAALKPEMPRDAVLRTLGAMQLFDAGRAPGQVGEAVAVVRRLAAHDLDVARLYVAQRGFVAVLDASPNRSVANYHLPDVLAGLTAGTHALQPLNVGVTGTDTGRGWRLSGAAGVLPNVRPDACQMALPVATGEPGRFAVVLLSAEADGVHLGAAVHLDQVFYREDETLDVDGATLMRAVGEPLRALQRGLA